MCVHFILSRDPSWLKNPPTFTNSKAEPETEEEVGGWSSSQLGKLVDGGVKLEVGREKFSSAGVDEPVGLPDGDVRHSSNVSNFCRTQEPGL